MADTDQDVNLPNLDPTKVGDEIAKKEGKPAVDKKSEENEDTNKSEQDKKTEAAKKAEQAKKIKEAEDAKKVEDDKKNKTPDSSQTIEEYTQEKSEELDNDGLENKEERFSEYKAVVSFSEAMAKAKKDPAGLAILKWVRQYIKHLDKFSDTTRAVIYSSLDREAFIDKSRSDCSFPQMPTDISPEEQSRKCINAFAKKYVTNENAFINDQDLLSIQLSYENLQKKRTQKNEDIEIDKPEAPVKIDNFLGTEKEQ